MEFSSLSLENRDKLLQLTESLIEVYDEKIKKTKEMEPIYDEINRISEEKRKYNELYKELSSISRKSVDDTAEFLTVIRKLKDLETEENNVNIVAKQLNQVFEEITRQEQEINFKITSLTNENNTKQNSKIYIDSLMTSVYIYEGMPSEIIEPISINNNKIIYCPKRLIENFSVIFNNYSCKKNINEKEKDELVELRENYLSAKAQEQEMIDKKMILVQRDSDNDKNLEENDSSKLVSEPSINTLEKEKIADTNILQNNIVEPISLNNNTSPVIDEAISLNNVAKPVIDDVTSLNNVTMPVIDETIPLNNIIEPNSINNSLDNLPQLDSNSNVVSIDEILNNNNNFVSNNNLNNINTQNNSNIIYISEIYKVNPKLEKIANSTKEKLEKRIRPTFEKMSNVIPKIQKIVSLEKKDVQNNDISSFLNAGSIAS